MKKLLYLILAIIIIVFVCYLCTTERIDNGNSILVNGKNQIENDVKNQEENTEVENETIENEIVENVIDEKNENTIENKTENTTSSETFEEEPKTEEEKAKDIVIKDWGNTNNIEIGVDGMNQNGSYIVTVRDSKTTEALAFYTVNVKDGTFTKKEMN